MSDLNESFHPNLFCFFCRETLWAGGEALDLGRYPRLDIILASELDPACTYDDFVKVLYACLSDCLKSPRSRQIQGAFKRVFCVSEGGIGELHARAAIIDE